MPKSWISWINLMKWIASLIAVERATCSASVVDWETVVCNLECHAIGQFAQKIANPVLDRLKMTKQKMKKFKKERHNMICPKPRDILPHPHPIQFD